MKQQDSGITLVEVLLVLVVGVTILVSAFKLYDRLRVDSRILELKSNVDTLFLAAANYYQVNCAKGGTLDPTIATGTVKTIDITTDLITPAFLPASFPPSNALVDPAAGPGLKGYVVQFNKYLKPRYQQTCSDPPTCSTLEDTQVGTVVIWQIQIAVKMKNTAAAQLAAYKTYLNADCLATATGTPGSTPLCSTSPTGNYLIFQRLPSAVMFNANAQSSFWSINPMAKQFGQMYTSNPITDLTGQDHSTEYQYFYCSS